MQQLQWSCNFIVTEIFTMSAMSSALCRLQWSCNFIVTEILFHLLETLQFWISFNGAVTLSLQKFCTSAVIDKTEANASMEL